MLNPAAQTRELSPSPSLDDVGMSFGAHPHEKATVDSGDTLSNFKFSTRVYQPGPFETRYCRDGIDGRQFHTLDFEDRKEAERFSNFLKEYLGIGVPVCFGEKVTLHPYCVAVVDNKFSLTLPHPEFRVIEKHKVIASAVASYKSITHSDEFNPEQLTETISFLQDEISKKGPFLGKLKFTVHPEAKGDRKAEPYQSLHDIYHSLSKSLETLSREGNLVATAPAPQGVFGRAVVEDLLSHVSIEGKGLLALYTGLNILDQVLDQDSWLMNQAYIRTKKEKRYNTKERKYELQDIPELPSGLFKNPDEFAYKVMETLGLETFGRLFCGDEVVLGQSYKETMDTVKTILFKLGLSQDELNKSLEETLDKAIAHERIQKMIWNFEESSDHELLSRDAYPRILDERKEYMEKRVKKREEYRKQHESHNL